MSVRDSWLLIASSVAIVIGLYLLLDHAAASFSAWWSDAAPEGEDSSTNQEREL